VSQTEPTANFEQTVAILRSAIPRMSEHKIPMTPANYAVWFSYLSEADPELRHEMQALLQRETPISADDMEALHERYVKQRDEQVASARDALSQVVDALMQQIGEADGHQNAFSDEMRNVAEGLSGEVTGDSLGILINRALEATSLALERGAAMKQKFSDLAVEMNQVRGELARSQQEARIDALTGQFNRLAFQEELSRLAHDAQDDAHPPCLLLLDIDFFKQVNDTYGHPGGDEVLQAVAHKVRSTVRPDDIVARYGGEEFAILLRDTPRSACMALAESVRLHIATHAIQLSAELGFSHTVSVTASLGGAWYRVSESIETLVERADRALYQSKDSGRNRVSWQN
jgi:diguanylate cyclase